MQISPEISVLSWPVLPERAIPHAAKDDLMKLIKEDIVGPKEEEETKE